ncbi:hypothetical protein BKA59DRAFT_553553 [Fusarium tricinctum]|uniref:Zn(2)-C6 fungal-type domain-containing protein n=1 Tax=Fusarium tricinctum TaxID=61284 RepID=A0A8K0S3C0_9HYPO|nr:hypothetical protein BKA59DRAFT_553553 [Fusarium tricinctum]
MSTSSPYNTARNGQDKLTLRNPKRTRTASNESDGASGRNRHRITRACNECRRRKDRCGGQRPSCASCVESSRVCSYGPSKKRGLRPGYVRAIEVLLGLVFTTVEGSESYVCGLLQGHIEQTSVRHQGSGIRESDISAEFLLEAWRKGSVAKEVAKLLSPEGVEDEDDGTDSTQHFDTKVSEALALFLSTTGSETGALLTPMNTDTTPQDVMAFDTLNSPVAAPPTSSFTDASPQISISHPPEPTTSHSISELPQNWPFLLDLYFETTHSWFPISQKHELLRAAYKLANSTSTTSDDQPSIGDIAFLQAVLLFASHQSAFISDSSKSAHNGTRDGTYNIRSSQDLVQTSLFANPSMYELGHVRAFLVLSLSDMDQKLWSAAWVNIGRAIYTATSIGLVDKNSIAASSNYEDNVKRTLLGCMALETIISVQLNTLPFFQSSDILSAGLLIIDGMEEWEPWQPKIVIPTATAQTLQGLSSHVPGHIISTFNRLLLVIASLNELTCQKRNPPTEETLLEIIRGCEQNLEGLSDPRTTADPSPQTLSLWMASIATLETAAAAFPVSDETSPERPGTYFMSVTSLVGLIERRVQSIGRCSIPPVVEACFGLLQQALDRQALLYVGTNVELDFNLLKKAIAGYLAILQQPLDGDMQLDATSNPQPNSGNTGHNSLQSSQPIAANTLIPPRTSIPSDTSSANVNLDSLLGTMDSIMSSNHPIQTSQSPGLTKGVAFEPPSASLGEDMGDDGLFDSLATLDSTEWLANPPEFMQHLGLLEKPPNDFESIFDIGL